MKRFVCVFLIILVLSLSKIYIFDSGSDRNFYCDEVSGFLYRAPWNTSYQLVFVTKDYSALVNTSGMSYETREKARKGAVVTICQTTFRIPESARNRGLFDQKRYYRSKGVSYICTPREDNIKFEGSYTFKALMHLPGARFRAYASDILYSKMNYESGNFTLAVMTGDTGRVSSDEKELFVSGGLSHLMCVSGMHVVYFLLPFRKAFENKYLDYKKRNFLLLIPLSLFLCLSDFSPSLVRASCSVLGVIISGIIRRKNDSLSNLFLSASLLLLINPYTVISTGFILSYLSVLSLQVIYPVFLRRFPFFQDNQSGNTVRIRLINKETLAAGICVNIGIAPAMLYMFGSYSLSGIFLTLIASPLAAVICVMGYACVILSSVPGISVIGTLIGKMLYFIYKALLKVASLSKLLPAGLGTVTVSRKNALIVCAFAYISVALIVLYDSGKFRNLKVKCLPKTKIAAAVLIVSAVLLFTSGYFLLIYDTSVMSVYAADVGQGLCVVVQSGSSCGMIDTGDGSNELCEILEGSNIDKLDFVIITHAHSDHTGGLPELFRNYKSTLIISDRINSDLDNLETEAISAGWDVFRVKTGDTVNFGRAKAGFMTVSEYFTGTTDEDENNSSLCVRLSCKYGSVFVAGDIQSEAEQIMAENNYLQNDDVLIVPHHGSKFSSTENLLMNIGAEYGIISVGRRNNYGHPSEEALKRLSDCGYEVIRTDQSGGIGIRIGRRTIIRKGRVSTWTML